MIQLTLTLRMTTAQVVETSVTPVNNSRTQDYVHPDDYTQPTYESIPGFKPFTEQEKYASEPEIAIRKDFFSLRVSPLLALTIFTRPRVLSRSTTPE